MPRLQHITKRFGSTVAVDHVSIEFAPEELSVVGRPTTDNGQPTTNN
jgi:ABC-type branched-subunit amino acid transport system ATPase component